MNPNFEMAIRELRAKAQRQRDALEATQQMIAAFEKLQQGEANATPTSKPQK